MKRWSDKWTNLSSSRAATTRLKLSNARRLALSRLSTSAMTLTPPHLNNSSKIDPQMSTCSTRKTTSWTAKSKLSETLKMRSKRLKIWYLTALSQSITAPTSKNKVKKWYNTSKRYFPWTNRLTKKLKNFLVPFWISTKRCLKATLKTSSKILKSELESRMVMSN